MFIIRNSSSYDVPYDDVRDIGGHHDGAVCGARNAYLSGAPDFTSGFHRGSCCPIICVSLFHVIVLSFGF